MDSASLTTRGRHTENQKRRRKSEPFAKLAMDSASLTTRGWATRRIKGDYAI
jgi:hypothetical protein